MNSGRKKSTIFDMLEAADEASTGTENANSRIQLEDIQPDPNQPRRTFDADKMSNLAASIKLYGVLQPIVVKRTGALPPYVIVTGERRWRASQIAGLLDIPAVVRDDDTDTDRGIVQLVENMNREDLSDLEVAEHIQRLIDSSGDPAKFGLKSEIAASLNRKPADISRLLTMLDTEWLPLVKEGIITSSDALSRFRSCPQALQEALIADARSSGEAITSGTIRSAKKIAVDGATAVAPAVVPTGSTVDTVAANPDAAAVAESGADATHDASPANVAPGADEIEQTGVPEGLPTSEANSADGTQPPTPGLADNAPDANAGDVDSDSDSGDDDGGDEGDDGSDNDSERSASSAGSFQAGAGREKSGGSSAVGTRAKGVELQLTGEKIEVLMRYLVDKSSDRLGLKVPGDLAIAIIENLGGTVPEDASFYSSEILALLDAKAA